MFTDRMTFFIIKFLISKMTEVMVKVGIELYTGVKNIYMKEGSKGRK